MKNISLLALSLVIALPGCCKKRCVAPSPRPSTIERYMDTPRNENIIQNDQETDEDDDINFDEIDFDEFDFDDEYSQSDESDTTSNDMETEDTEDQYAWIDSQDDEMRKVYFSFNHYGIKADQQTALEYNIDQLHQLISESNTAAQPTIVVEGHTDQEGDRLYNIGLSEKRAKTVADRLVASGIDRSLIKVIGRGQECPVVLNGKVVDGSREDRAPNRRVEIRVIYT